MAVQTVFEGYEFNSPAKLRKNQLKYDVPIPMAHAPGSKNIHGIPQIMKNFRTGGTPWTVIINENGLVVYNNFHIDADRAALLIERLLSENR